MILFVQRCSDRCHLSPDPGSCNDNVPTFYYDYQEATCKKFIYGGCGGNENRFKSKRACQQKCEGL